MTKYSKYIKISEDLAEESPQVITAFLDNLTKIIMSKKMNHETLEKIRLAFSSGLCDLVSCDYIPRFDELHK